MVKNIPYVTYSTVGHTTCDHGCVKSVKVYLTVCLVDHNIVGSGKSIKISIERMLQNFTNKYDNCHIKPYDEVYHIALNGDSISNKNCNNSMSIDELNKLFDDNS